jgi:peptidoglycan/LPS O-acetylase OafA/YrhL
MKPIGADKAILQYRRDLDGLRAISCLLVFFFHVHESKAWLGLFPWLPFLEGWVGVYVFFVLSGFLITSLLIGEESKYGCIHFGRFLARREFRIVPAYYAAIALYGILCLTPIARQYASQYRAGFWYWVLYSGDIASIKQSVGTLFGHSWSLAIEQRFYFVWPVALFAFSRARWARAMVFIAAICIVPFLPLGNGYLALILGSAIAFLHAAGVGEGLLRKAPVEITAGACLAWIVVLHWCHPTTKPFTAIAPFSMLVAVFVYQLTVSESWVKRLLGIRPLVWLGQRSYSFYLVHVICLNIVMRIFNSATIPGALAVIAGGIALAAAVAALSYRVIEEPFRRYGKKLLDTKATPLQAVPQ